MNYLCSVASNVLLYSYCRSFDGFAVKLTEDEANKLEGRLSTILFVMSNYGFSPSITLQLGLLVTIDKVIP